MNRYVYGIVPTLLLTLCFLSSAFADEHKTFGCDNPLCNCAVCECDVCDCGTGTATDYQSLKARVERLEAHVGILDFTSPAPGTVVATPCPTCPGGVNYVAFTSPPKKVVREVYVSAPAKTYTSYSSYYTGGGYWTYPGRTRTDLINHLMSGDHAGQFSREQLNSMSYDELMREHSGHHIALRGGTTRTMYVGSSYVAPPSLPVQRFNRVGARIRTACPNCP